MNPFEENSIKTQGSAAWLEDRKLGIGGSEIAIVLGLSPYKTPYQLWLEKTGLIEPEDISSLPHVMRGTLAEPVARKKLEDSLGFKLAPMVYDQRGDVRFSSDGTNQQKGVFIEIKAMGLDAHLAAGEGGSQNVPAHYMPQVVWGFGADQLMTTCYFVSVRPEDGHRCHVITIERTPEIDSTFKDYRTKAMEFMTMVRTKTPPPLTSRDCVAIENNQVFEADVELWQRAKMHMAEAEAALEHAETLLKAWVDDEAAGSVEGYGVKITRVQRQGTVSWSKIPQVKALPPEVIEPYRGAPSVSVRITAKKEGKENG